MRQSAQHKLAQGSLASVVDHLVRDLVRTVLELGALALATAAVKLALPAYIERPRRR